MPDVRIRLVRNDTRPELELTVRDELTGAPVNLSGATVRLHMKPASGGEVLIREAVVPYETAMQGVAVVVWEPGDLDLEPGSYLGEIEVTFSGGQVQTVYDFLRFEVREEIA